MNQSTESKIGTDIKIIIGLGNPGKEYADTYHNTGMLFINFLLTDSGANSRKQSAPATDWHSVAGKHFRYAKIDNMILAEPVSYMNESGRAVREICQYFKAAPEDIMIAHDDTDIDLGDYKMTKGQGSAGHRGVASIINEMKTTDFWRLRIGIKKESALRAAIGMKAKIKAGNYVLKKISKKDSDLIHSAFGRIYKELAL